MKTASSTARAMAWADATQLPIVGDSHPLRARYTTHLYRALSIALSVHLTAFSGFSIARLLHRDPPMRERQFIVFDPAFAPMPPPIVPRPETERPLEQVIKIAQAEIGIPVPVEPWKCEELSFPKNEDFANFQPAMDPAAPGWREGDSISVVIPEAQGAGSPDPGDFVAAEEMPVLIHLPAPVYPEMARQAEMEGVVMIRALVGKDGKVQRAFVTESAPMLDDAAIAAALRAVFKPALQQHKPVAVWVQIPMRFTLR